jgi:hypothetical protein
MQNFVVLVATPNLSVLNGNVLLQLPVDPQMSLQRLHIFLLAPFNPWSPARSATVNVQIILSVFSPHGPGCMVLLESCLCHQFVIFFEA